MVEVGVVTICVLLNFVIEVLVIELIGFAFFPVFSVIQKLSTIRIGIFVVLSIQIDI